MSSRAFTFKSILLGFIGVLLVSIFPAYSRSSLHLGSAVQGYLPILPLLILVLLSCVWNMLAARISRKLCFNTKELAVIFGLMLMVAWLPELQHTMARQLVLPRYEELTTNANWKEAGVTRRLPDRLFPHGETGELIGEKTHFGMIQGGMAVRDIPYRAWVFPLLQWMPFVLVFVLCLIAMSFIVHRQWTRHEQLRYPLAAVVNALVEQDESKPGGRIYRNRLFLFGFGLIFALNLLRYLHVWFPNNLPDLPIQYVLVWHKLFPSINESNASMFVFHWMPISFALIGIAFLVPADVSLSIGLTAPLGTFLAVQYYLVTGHPVSSASLDIMRAGGFLAFGIILMYTGRTYYFPVLRKAIWPGNGKGKPADSGGVWAARVFLTAYVALILIVASMGTGMLMSWVIVTALLLIFLVVTRLVCETGVPTIMAGWSMTTVLTGLLGPMAVGASPIMFLILLGSTIASSNSTTLVMPYVATSLKVMDDNRVSLARFTVVAKVAILVAMVAGFAAVITLAYSEGEGNLLRNERAVWTQGVRQVLSMMDFGQYEASEAAHGMSRIGLIRPDGNTFGLVVAGLAAVLGCYVLRFRFAKWPLHPLFFVVLGTQFANLAWVNFFLGWGIKSLMVRVGGGRVYRDVRPLFIGFIVGEFMLVALSLVVGLIYHLCTKGLPVSLGS